MREKLKLARQALARVSSHEALVPGDVLMVLLAIVNLLTEIVRELEKRDVVPRVRGNKP